MSMSYGRTSVFVVMVWSAASGVWGGSDANTAFREGQALLATGDLRAALKQHIAAVKADSDNEEYVQQYRLVRHALALQDAVAKETDAKRWEQSAVALRYFFSERGLHAQALSLDRAMWERSKTSDNAIQFADTLLSLKKCDEAATVLASLPVEQATGASQALLAVALARQDKLADARNVASRVEMPAKDDPGALFVVARMHAALGDADQAIAALTRCFEAVPPSQLDALKTLARQCQDFGKMASLASFATVMQTVSKVPESKCSGGSSCSTCPMRGNCASGTSK